MRILRRAEIGFLSALVGFLSLRGLLYVAATTADQPQLSRIFRLLPEALLLAGLVIALVVFLSRPKKPGAVISFSLLLLAASALSALFRHEPLTQAVTGLI